MSHLALQKRLKISRFAPSRCDKNSVHLLSLEERRKAAQFMIEKTNVVLGILQSNSLKTGKTRKLAKQLSATIVTLDSQIKYVLLPLDDEILGRSITKTLTPEFLIKAGEAKLKLESDVQKAYSFIAQLKTAFT